MSGSPLRLSLALAVGLLAAAPSSASAQAIEGQYIVVMKSRSSGAAVEHAKERARTHGGRVQHQYSSVLKGFSARLDEQALTAVRADPAVDYVEPDRMIKLDTSQTNAPWGLDRIDQRAFPLNAIYDYGKTGAGVTAYVIDTGMRFTHNDFGGRAVSGYDAIDGGAADDCNGHGTHVAGTLGGTTWGVAKGVKIVAVRVLGCNGMGPTSGVIAGINWVTADHTSGPAVANMSLGGGTSSALDTAVRNSIADGITYAVAAGNSGANACGSSPARVAEALTVGATTSSDERSSFSNYGTCLDLFAPGSNILSAWYTSDATVASLSGTSMASPHVAGAAAVILEANPAASPAVVAATIRANATTNVVSNAGVGSPNLLLYSPPPPPNAAPAARFTYSCSGLTCYFNGYASADADGTVASYRWDFGDGTSATDAYVRKVFAQYGTDDVKLTVTDDAGATGERAESITLLRLTGTGARVGGFPTVTLSWNGSPGALYWVYRGATKVGVVAGSTLIDRPPVSASGAYSYAVCQASGPLCTASEVITVP